MYKFCDNGYIFTWFLAQTNIEIDKEKNFKLLDVNNINNGTTEKTNLSNKKNYENQNSRLKITVEHSLNIYKDILKTEKSNMLPNLSKREKQRGTCHSRRRQNIHTYMYHRIV